MLSDTHCHLYFDAYDQDRESVIERAREVGVRQILIPGIDVQTSQEAVSFAQQYPEFYAAVGVHPNDALTWNGESLDNLRDLASREKVVAIGEIGLDYYRDRTPFDVQRDVFERQLFLASEMGLPVIVHTRNQSNEDRKAIRDALDILREWQTGLVGTRPILAMNPGVLHAFSGNEAEAQAALEINFAIGIAGPVTFQNAPVLQHLVEKFPLEHMLLETDAPFLTPHPYRGKRNEPAYVRLVAEKVAVLKDLPVDMVEDITGQNAERVFHWRVNH